MLLESHVVYASWFSGGIYNSGELYQIGKSNDYEYLIDSNSIDTSGSYVEVWFIKVPISQKSISESYFEGKKIDFTAYWYAARIATKEMKLLRYEYYGNKNFIYEKHYDYITHAYKDVKTGTLEEFFYNAAMTLYRQKQKSAQ